MASAKKRLTLDLDAPLQERLKAVAEQKGVTMRQYCQTAIEKELAEDETEDEEDWSHLPNAEFFTRLQKKYFGDRVLPGNSVDLIRKGREMRTAQIEQALGHEPSE